MTLEEAYRSIYKEDHKLSALKGFVDKNVWKIVYNFPPYKDKKIYPGGKIYTPDGSDMNDFLEHLLGPTGGTAWFVQWKDGLCISVSPNSYEKDSATIYALEDAPWLEIPSRVEELTGLNLEI